MMPENEFDTAFSTAFDAVSETPPPIPVSGICVPETDWGCVDEAWVAGLDPAVKARSEALAWTTLQALSGYRISLCPITVRPCSRGCIEAARTWSEAPAVYGSGFYGSSGGFNPSVNSDGMWVNSCGCGPRDCSCSVLSEARLVGPVGGVVSVTINGAVLSPSAYRVDNGNLLVRTDGGVWPACQDMASSLGDTAKQTFGVTYYMGFAPDALSAYAAGVLAVEYAKACTGKKCALPSGVTTITRQGVSMEIQAGLFPNGFTGIQTVDAWLYTVNPSALKQPPRVSSPDYNRPRMTTYPNG